MKGKRNVAVAAVLLILAAALVWGSTRLSWMGVTIDDAGMSPQRHVNVTGGTWAPALLALALLFLAAIAAGLALKGWARAVVALVVAAGAIGTAFPALSVLTQEPDVGYITTTLEGDSVMAIKDYVSQVDKTPLGPSLALVGALCAVIAAVLLIRGVRGSGMGSKYQSPAARRAELEKRAFDGAAAAKASERDLWDALDGGDDPTEAAKGVGPERPDAEG